MCGRDWQCSVAKQLKCVCFCFWGCKTAPCISLALRIHPLNHIGSLNLAAPRVGHHPRNFWNMQSHPSLSVPVHLWHSLFLFSLLWQVFSASIFHTFPETKEELYLDPGAQVEKFFALLQFCVKRVIDCPRAVCLSCKRSGKSPPVCAAYSDGWCKSMRWRSPSYSLALQSNWLRTDSSLEAFSEDITFTNC